MRSAAPAGPDPLEVVDAGELGLDQIGQGQLVEKDIQELIPGKGEHEIVQALAVLGTEKVKGLACTVALRSYLGNAAAGLHLVIYSAGLIAVMLYFPSGIAGALGRLADTRKDQP